VKQAAIVAGLFGWAFVYAQGRKVLADTWVTTLDVDALRFRESRRMPAPCRHYLSRPSNFLTAASERVFVTSSFVSQPFRATFTP